MALTAEQRKVLATILRVGQRKGASPKQIKAAVETGLVESNLRNLPGGDADSQGWRQERASLYSNPRDLEASVGRFFDETAPLRGKYGRAGALAAAVQRPAAQYRGRYEERSGEAEELIGGQSGGGLSSSPGRTSTRTVGGVDRSSERRAAIARFIADDNADPLDMALEVKALADVPGRKVTERIPSSSKSAQGLGNGSQRRSPLFELFWNGPGAVNVKNGQRQPKGFVPGHTDHVHVAAGPKTVDELGRVAQAMGLRVGENETFDPVDPVHVKGSYHFRNRAIDVSGDPKRMAAFARRVARSYGIS